MRFSTTIIALAAAATTNGLNVFRGDDQSVILGDPLEVPGQNPLKYCDADRGDDIIDIEKVTLTPNPPEAGTTLVIEATGTVKEDIEEGAYVMLQVKYGYIRLINTQADLCKEMKNVEMECPIEKGKITITKSVELPKEIPPGKYTVLADVFSKDDDHITCLTAVVWFGPKKGFTGGLLGDL
ncbi:putative Phosphatidylglycerol/phosphatidylinositol transfer protein precursor [Podospora fimiseda]|uniref:Phosphatidylglycerol/phosphatidylinositol transfer protein n=1 Tax=Podospora fimiseda TaxID=252190 RepID=A0AAN7BMX6_9PEZI|nr:putative Phosphatidylglycerol/phosphatidylinositol transfer protein precursor [Podospora fimiseda]